MKVFKVLRVVIGLLLYVWCLVGFGYNLFEVKDYPLTILWAVTSFLPMTLIFNI